MLSKRSISKSGIGKTLIIILGVIIALLLTYNSPLFTAEVFNLTGSEVEPVAEMPKDQNSKLKGSGSTFNSTAQLFHIFTMNSPFLNNK
ncbi:MAG: hypothetical protein CMB80_10210 [Flammeovirgaceae bacterium]|nr:hypothetical protein [Flammeovirgaceae bacterium]MBE61361.1 hypothetical protein [Flammeovirgaceae bacterium]MBR09505.1 hypothetical protein [Rickettsiales bacterium]HCX21268.1 hypothetical protein [Cytophagales bacterium]|tara:strand:- start:926 stop:1192 length:267 start_codon:yes stop_codon:yes gene_type:complete